MHSPTRAPPGDALVKSQKRQLILLSPRKTVSVAWVPASARGPSWVVQLQSVAELGFTYTRVITWKLKFGSLWPRLEVGFCLPQQAWSKGCLRSMMPPAQAERFPAARVYIAISTHLTGSLCIHRNQYSSYIHC